MVLGRNVEHDEVVDVILLSGSIDQHCKLVNHSIIINWRYDPVMRNLSLTHTLMHVFVCTDAIE